jgi:hypothetical protein
MTKWRGILVTHARPSFAKHRHDESAKESVEEKEGVVPAFYRPLRPLRHPVIARSEATKQSNSSTLHWIASLRSQ